MATCTSAEAEFYAAVKAAAAGIGRFNDVRSWSDVAATRS